MKVSVGSSSSPMHRNNSLSIPLFSEGNVELIELLVRVTIFFLNFKKMYSSILVVLTLQLCIVPKM